MERVFAYVSLSELSGEGCTANPVMWVEAFERANGAAAAADATCDTDDAARRRRDANMVSGMMVDGWWGEGVS